ncbi:MAG: SulP family inorganic anion transporter, partial [Hyphomicrobiales bacterium]
MKLLSSPDKLFDNDLFRGAIPHRDAISGFVASLVTVGYCISFAALIFQGDIAPGLGLGLSALLTGTAITGVIVALTTTLVPTDAGPDTPAVAVMSVLAGSIASGFIAADLPIEQAITHVLLAITISTVITGALLFAFGAMRLGIWLRFVPYPVIGGFLAASGWLLLTGGLEVMTGVQLGLSFQSIADTFSIDKLPQLAVGLGLTATVFALRSRIDSFLILPLSFLAFVIAADLILLVFDKAEALGGRGAWFIEGMGDLHLWIPASVIMTENIDWGVFAANAAEIGAVCGVTAVSLLLDVSSLEVARQKSADLDAELRSNGIANVVAGLLGGVAGNLSLNGSILIKEAGAASRLSGVCAGITTAGVLLSGIDLAGLIPTPILGGLLAYLGIVILGEAIVRAPARRSFTDLALAAAIMAVIVYSGYLMGVLLGVVGACLLFAFSYSRIGVVSRHLTRKNCASNVERGPEQARLLSEHGERIHVFWLSGFIFFGSSNGLFEYVRRCMDSRASRDTCYLVLDFASVPGLDTSAVLSL